MSEQGQAGLGEDQSKLLTNELEICEQVIHSVTCGTANVYVSFGYDATMS